MDLSQVPGGKILAIAAGTHHTALAWQGAQGEHAVLVWGVNLDGQGGGTPIVPPQNVRMPVQFTSRYWTPQRASLFEGNLLALPVMGPWHPSLHQKRAPDELLRAALAFVAAVVGLIPVTIAEEVVAAVATHHGFLPADLTGPAR